MRRIWLLLVAVALAAVVTAAASAAATPVRPLQASCTTTFTMGVDPVAHVPTATIVGTCRMSHLGLTRYSATELLYPDGSIVNTGTYTAANGDMLFVKATGSGVPLTPTTLALSFTETVTGGTGRFAHVVPGPLTSGVGVVDMTTWSAWFTSVGSIAY